MRGWTDYSGELAETGIWRAVVEGQLRDTQSEPPRPLYRVGDVVVLRKTSVFYQQAPNYCLGRIVGYTPRTLLPYRVNWTTGYENSYAEGDLRHPLSAKEIEVEDSNPSVGVGDIVKIVDVGWGYNRKVREDYIGFYYQVEGVVEAYPLNWYNIYLKSIDPAKTSLTASHLTRVRLQKLIRPPTRSEEDVDKVTE